MHKVLNLETWDQFFFNVPEWFKTYVFRGQANSDWMLESSFNRVPFGKHIRNERKLIRKFTSGSTNYNLTHTPNSTLEWLSLMQHYGLPTRLLDFTTSPFIAAYFAFEMYSSIPRENLLIDKTVSIWAIEINTIKQFASELLPKSVSEEVHNINGELHRFYSEEIFELIFCDRTSRPFCFLCAPTFQSQRMLNQQSVFLSGSQSNVKTYRQLSEMKLPDGVVFEITIPISETRNALRYLSLMNINAATLFPSLDGLAKKIKMDSEIEFKIHPKFSSKFPAEYPSFSEYSHLVEDYEV